MSTPEGTLSAAPDVPANQSSSGVSQTADSSSAQDTATSSADVNTQQAVDGAQSQSTQSQSDDPLAGFPSDEELNAAVANKTPWAEMAQRLKGAYEPLRRQHEEISGKFKVFEPAADRFQSPDDFQKVLGLHDSLLGWENDAQTGTPIPATEAGAKQLAAQYPLHADYLAADLLDLPTRDPITGESRRRIEVVLAGMKDDPAERALALKILGGVEPGTQSPQWAPTPEELESVKPELQDFYKSLPWEEREELKALSPEYLNRTLQREKLTRDLEQQQQQSQQRDQQQAQRREEYLNQQASQAGESYLSEQLQSALTTFHESVVQQCQFLQPLDPANLPQGITPEQATGINAQIAQSNKAEAAQISGLIVSLFNPQTSTYVVPLLKEIGALDDRVLGELNNAANTFGSNGRNFGNLRYRGQLQRNGNGQQSQYSPTADVTQLENESRRALQRMIGYANQIKKSLIDHRSKFFELRATQHNETINGASPTRPQVNGQHFDPTRSVSTQQPNGWLSRNQINQQFG